LFDWFAEKLPDGECSFLLIALAGIPVSVFWTFFQNIDFMNSYDHSNFSTLPFLTPFLQDKGTRAGQYAGPSMGFPIIFDR